MLSLEWGLTRNDVTRKRRIDQYCPRNTVAITDASEQANKANKANSMRAVKGTPLVITRVDSGVSEWTIPMDFNAHFDGR